jgi:hypothetical protein
MHLSILHCICALTGSCIDVIRAMIHTTESGIYCCSGLLRAQQ